MNFDAADRFFCGFLQTKKGKKLRAIATVAVVAVIFLAQMFFSYLTPLSADDYGYSFSCDTDEKLTSVSQLIPSILAHNQTTNGRSVNHIIAQFFLMVNNVTPPIILYGKFATL